MKIDHIAIWTKQLEKMKHFYEHYFQGVSGEKYINPRKNFESYFISFEGTCRLEIMEKLEINKKLPDIEDEYLGITHFAMSTGSREMVDELTDRMRKDAIQVVGEPRVTGDGYYESVVLDPDGNKVEITE